MLLTYLKQSFRLLTRNPFIALINIAGLSVGFAVFIVLWQHSQNELTSDQQWNDSERIARVCVRWEWTNDGQTWQNDTYGLVGSTVSTTLANQIPKSKAIQDCSYKQSSETSLPKASTPGSSPTMKRLTKHMSQCTSTM
ncbi:MAG TPA: hypothetical protein VFE50_25945 [Cyclobacteriaceae bacterium]|nr:hypothetical protein [Cyclobacteriaceae bacterium]